VIFFHTLHSTSLSEYCHNVRYEKKLEWCGYRRRKTFDDNVYRFDTIPACDGRTDRRTSCDNIVRAIKMKSRRRCFFCTTLLHSAVFAMTILSVTLVRFVQIGLDRHTTIALTLYGHIKTAEQRTIIRWLVHWPMIDGLLHLIQQGGAWADWGHDQSPPRCTKCNRPPTASVPTSYYLMWHYIIASGL